VSALDRLLLGCILAAAALVAGVLELRHYGAEQYRAGHAAAGVEGEKLRQAEADHNRKTESDLRDQLAQRDADANKKEQTYAANLEAAQRRVRAGTDRLQCPAASPVQSAATAADGPVAAGLEVEPAGPALMPESAADLLGVAADVAGLVRRYDRLEQRFEECRALNAK
jgi:hypothetical protein